MNNKVVLSKAMIQLVDWYRYEMPIPLKYKDACYLLSLRGRDIVKQRKAEKRCGLN